MSKFKTHYGGVGFWSKFIKANHVVFQVFSSFHFTHSPFVWGSKPKGGCRRILLSCTLDHVVQIYCFAASFDVAKCARTRVNKIRWKSKSSGNTDPTVEKKSFARSADEKGRTTPVAMTCPKRHCARGNPSQAELEIGDIRTTAKTWRGFL